MDHGQADLVISGRERLLLCYSVHLHILISSYSLSASATAAAGARAGEPEIRDVPRCLPAQSNLFCGLASIKCLELHRQVHKDFHSHLRQRKRDKLTSKV